MKIFVFYNDGYADNGDVGVAEFDSKGAAAQFIQQRMARADKPSLDQYRIIEGREVKAKITEIATRIDL